MISVAGNVDIFFYFLGNSADPKDVRLGVSTKQMVDYHSDNAIYQRW